MECASIQRAASSIAWCPISTIPSLSINSNRNCNPLYLLASVHQEVDASFNSSPQIEILNTSPSSINTQKKNKNHSFQPLGCCASKQNFTTLAWGNQTNPTDATPLGLIAGGMEDGCITFWNPYNLINGKSKQSLIGSYSDYHQQKITAMAFNPNVNQHTFLATADEAEKLYVWDLTNPSSPKAQQPPTGKRTEVSSTYPKYATAIAWNNNVSYILALSTCHGQTQIYDLRNRKVALTFETRSPDKAQAVSWNPKKPRQLAVCYVGGSAEIWDLKQPKSPRMYLRDDSYGRTTGILDLSWSNIDSNLLLTSNEYDDGQRIQGCGNIWNGNTGKLIHQIPFGNDRKFKIEWNNSRGGILATMSSEEISIYNINYLGEYCPRWLYSKCGVDMGFGGKIISWGNQYIISQSSSSNNLRSSSSSNASAVETPNKIKKKLKIPPNINIDYLPKSDAMIARAKQFEKTLNSLNTPNDLIQFIQFKLKELNRIKIAMQNKPKKDDKGNDSDKDILADLGISDDDNTEDEKDEIKEENKFDNIDENELNFEIKTWEMIELFFNENNCIDDIIKYLGFEKQQLIKQSEQIIEQKSNQEEIKPNITKKTNLSVDTTHDDGHDPIFGDESDSDDPENFFNQLSEQPIIPQASSMIQKDKSTDEEFKIIKKPIEKKDESNDRNIANNEQIDKRFIEPGKGDIDVKNAIISGNYELAVDLALKGGNIADALVFAYYSKDDALWDIVKNTYFKQHSQQFIGNTFCYIAEGDYTRLVETSDLNKWKETLAILLTFTSGDECNQLCNILGHRILEHISNLEGAVACFLCSHNISLLISIWNMQINKSNLKPTDMLLNTCITKALIYVNTPYVQQSLMKQITTYNSGQIALNNIFCKYANLLANQGSLKIAQMFLKFVDQKLKKPQGRSANDPQIKQLINRIDISQQCEGANNVYQPRQQTYNNNTSNDRNNRPPPPHVKRRGGTARRGNVTRGGTRPIRRSQNMASVNDNTTQNLQTKSPKPTRPVRKSRGGMSRDSNRSSRGGRGGSSRGGSRHGRGPPTNTSQPKNQPIQNQPIQNQPIQSQPKNSGSNMPTRDRGMRGRGRGRGAPPGRGRGRGPPPSNPPRNPTQMQHQQQTNPNPSRNIRQPPRNQSQRQNQHQPAPNRRQPPTNNNNNIPQQSGHGMNGTTQMPNRNRGRGIRQPAQSHPSQINQRPPSQINQRQPSQSHPSQINQRQPPQNNNNMQSTQSNTMPNRSRGRGRGGPRGRAQGRGRGGRGGRTSRSQNQPTQHPVQQVEEIADRPIGYSASQASSGSGFFGQTSLIDDDENNETQLPSDVGNTLENIKTYLHSIIEDSTIMNQLQITHSKKLQTESGKLLKDLNDLIMNNKMSVYAYSSLLEIYNLLQSKQYDNAMKKTTEFIRSCKSNTQEKFNTHRKWVLGFQSIIRIAKQYNI